MLCVRTLLSVTLLVTHTLPCTPEDAVPTPVAIAPNLARLAGVDPSSGIRYVRFFLTESPGDAMGSSEFDLSRPTLTAQCTQDVKGKLRFELFVNFGNVTDPTFYPPWRPTSDTDFPPRTEKLNVTMEFLGYTKFKPVRRQFEKVLEPYGQLRYNNPGGGSSNMEDLSYYLQVLRALPTLRLTAGTQTASFLTTPLLAQLHAEPLCRASGA